MSTSTSPGAEKENERNGGNQSKEKRISVDSPSTLLSPVSRMVHKKPRASFPLSVKSNSLAGDAGSLNLSMPASGYGSSTSRKANDEKKTEAGTTMDAHQPEEQLCNSDEAIVVDEEGFGAVGDDQHQVECSGVPSAVVEDQSSMPKQPQDIENGSSKVSKDVSYMAMAGDPLLDATAIEEASMVDNQVSMERENPTTAQEEDKLDESQDSNATLVDESVLPQGSPTHSTGSIGSEQTQDVSGMSAEQSFVKDIDDGKAATAEGPMESSPSEEVDDKAKRSAEASKSAATLLMEQKRRVRASMVEPPCTPIALLDYARERIDDYSFRINEAFCDESQLCDNCYALRVELENITKNLLAVSAEHQKCKERQDLNRSVLECMRQEGLVPVNEEIIRLTTENAQLKRTMEQRNVERTELDELRNENSKLKKKCELLQKDIEDYKFIMEQELTKWKTTALDLRKQISQMESKVEEATVDEGSLKKIEAELQAKYERDLEEIKKRLQAETIDARALVNENMASEMDALKSELISLNSQLIDVKESKCDLESRLASVTSDREELLSKVFAFEESSVATEECKHLQRRLQELEARLATEKELNMEPTNSPKSSPSPYRRASFDANEASKHQQRDIEHLQRELHRLAEEREHLQQELCRLAEEREGLLAKIVDLKRQLDDEREANEIVQDALKGSEIRAEQLAKQLELAEQNGGWTNRMVDMEMDPEEQQKLRERVADLEYCLENAQKLEAPKEEASRVELLESQLVSKDRELEAIRAELQAKLAEHTDWLRQINDHLVEFKKANNEAAKEGSEGNGLVQITECLRTEFNIIGQKTANSIMEVLKENLDKESQQMNQMNASLELLNELRKRIEEETRELQSQWKQIFDIELGSAKLQSGQDEQMQKNIAEMGRMTDQLNEKFSEEFDGIKSRLEQCIQDQSNGWEGRIKEWIIRSDAIRNLLTKSTNESTIQCVESLKAILAKEIGDMSDRIANGHDSTTLSEISDNIAKIKYQLDTMKAKDEQILLAQHEAVNRELEDCKKEKVEIENQLHQTVEELRREKDAGNENKQKLARLELELKKFEQSAREFVEQSQQLAALKEDLKDAKIQLETGKNMIRRRDEELLAKSGQLEDLEKELEQNKQLFDKELSEIRSERDTVINGMKDEIVGYLEKLSTARRSLDESRSRIKELEDQLAHQKAQPMMPSENIQQMTEKQEEMSRQIEVLKAENERLAKACDGADDEIDALQEENVELKQKIALMEGLSKEEAGQRIGRIAQVELPKAQEETIVSTECEPTISSESITDETQKISGDDSKSGSMKRSKGIKSPWKKKKSPKKKDVAAANEEQASCRTQ